MLTAEKFNIKLTAHFLEYYPLLEQWWKDWKFTPMSPDLLSTNGVMIKKDGVCKCAGWLYITDSAFAVLGWIISAKERDREGWIELLVEEIEKIARSYGCQAIMAPAKNPNLKSKLEKVGYGKYADNNMTNYFKNLWEV